MDLKIKYQAPDKLVPNPNNARTHSEKQISQIMASIDQFTFTNPILIDDNNMIIAGHGRWMAALKLELEKIPTIKIKHLSKDEVRALVIADNKLAELAGWDAEILAIEFQYFMDTNLDFDIGITGFETAEIDFLIDNHSSIDLDLEDDHIEPNKDVPAATKTGDIYKLGKHRLYCGDSLNSKSYGALLKSTTAAMVFTDPPYNVPIQGHVGGKGEIQHREFKMASGEMSSNEFTDFLAAMLSAMAQHLIDGAIAYVCMDWRHTSELDAARKRADYEHKNTCIWVKDNGGMGSLYRSRHEFIYVLKHGKAPHVNNIELGKHGRYRTNVWEYAGVNTFRKDRLEELSMHPTVKPVALVMDAIKDCSKRGGVILDPFGGSGTTLIASERTGRQARLIEIDPHYCDVIVKRWEDLTGKKAKKIKGDK